MATCPRCGRGLNDQIYVPLSETKNGVKTITCVCGYSINYVAPAVKQKVQTMDFKTREPLNPGYELFAIALTVVAGILLSIIFVREMPTEDVKGFMKFISSVAFVLMAGFVVILLSLPAFKRASYITHSSARIVRRNRIWANIVHVIGCLLLLAIIAGSIYVFTVVY